MLAELDDVEQYGDVVYVTGYDDEVLNGQTILHMFRRYDSRASRLSWQIFSRPSTPIHGDEMPGLCILLGTSY
jgi:hypothetical protein